MFHDLANHYRWVRFPELASSAVRVEPICMFDSWLNSFLLLD